jgi:hypothetical protein
MTTATAKIDVAKCIHRDIYPHTDHGYTWVECCWYERDGRRCSAQFPVAGCCERLMHLPGGPLPDPDWEWEERRFNVVRTVKTEEIHEGLYSVGSVSITPR